MKITPIKSAETSLKWVDVPTQNVKAAETSFAYRKLGEEKGVPVILLNHWGANLDNFDPRIVDGLATQRTVIAVNYRGSGASGGEVPLTVSAMARDMIAFIEALGFKQVDLFGFSLGGFVAQEITIQRPDLIRKIILAGTGPAGGRKIARVGSTAWLLFPKAILTGRDPKYYLFFTKSENGKRSAKDFLNRLQERKDNRDKPNLISIMLQQLRPIKAWAMQPSQNLEGLKQPALIANGDHDTMVPSEYSKELARRIPNAELVIYPDAGHGGIFQQHQDFVQRALRFLTDDK